MKCKRYFLKLLILNNSISVLSKILNFNDSVTRAVTEGDNMSTNVVQDTSSQYQEKRSQFI